MTSKDLFHTNPAESVNLLDLLSRRLNELLPGCSFTLDVGVYTVLREETIHFFLTADTSAEDQALLEIVLIVYHSAKSE